MEDHIQDNPPVKDEKDKHREPYSIGIFILLILGIILASNYNMNRKENNENSENHIFSRLSADKIKRDLASITFTQASDDKALLHMKRPYGKPGSFHVRLYGPSPEKIERVEISSVFYDKKRAYAAAAINRDLFEAVFPDGKEIFDAVHTRRDEILNEKEVELEQDGIRISILPEEKTRELTKVRIILQPAPTKFKLRNFFRM